MTPLLLSKRPGILGRGNRKPSHSAPSKPALSAFLAPSGTKFQHPVRQSRYFSFVLRRRTRSSGQAKPKFIL